MFDLFWLVWNEAFEVSCFVSVVVRIQKLLNSIEDKSYFKFCKLRITVINLTTKKKRQLMAKANQPCKKCLTQCGTGLTSALSAARLVHSLSSSAPVSTETLWYTSSPTTGLMSPNTCTGMERQWPIESSWLAKSVNLRSLTLTSLFIVIPSKSIRCHQGNTLRSM